MFEVGKKYEFTFLTATEDGLCDVGGVRWFVKAIEGTLLHLHKPADHDSAFAKYVGGIEESNMVLNTASAFFHSATPVEEK